MKSLYMAISKNLILNLDQNEWIRYLATAATVDLSGNVEEWIIPCKWILQITFCYNQFMDI